MVVHDVVFKLDCSELFRTFFDFEPIGFDLA